MLTGDAVAIAIETCKQLALGTNVYDSERLIGSSMSGSDVRDFVEAADGFAEVFPEHKYQVRSQSLDIVMQFFSSLRELSGCFNASRAWPSYCHDRRRRLSQPFNLA